MIKAGRRGLKSEMAMPISASSMGKGKEAWNEPYTFDK